MDVKAPLVQLYVSAPLLVKVAEPPEHTSVLLNAAPAVTVGEGFTITICAAVAGHPALLTPVTLYELETEGATVNVAPGEVAVAQLYVAAPLTVRVAVLPSQTRVGVALVTKVGVGFTVTVIMEELTPQALDP